jgi:plastocyanin
MAQALHSGPGMKSISFRFSRLLGLALLCVVLASSSFVLAADSASVTGQVATNVPKQRANVVVFLEKVSGSFRPQARPVEIDQKGMKFVPHVVAIQKGQTVVFRNSDNVRHNIFTPDGDKYNLGTWGQGESKTHTFAATGVYHQLCNIHPEMGGIIMVLDNPFFSVTGDDGKFVIPNVPPGKYTLKTWGEKLPDSTREITVVAGAPTNVQIKLGR